MGFFNGLIGVKAKPRIRAAGVNTRKRLLWIVQVFLHAIIRFAFSGRNVLGLHSDLPVPDERGRAGSCMV